VNKLSGCSNLSLAEVFLNFVCIPKLGIWNATLSRCRKDFSAVGLNVTKNGFEIGFGDASQNFSAGQETNKFIEKRRGTGYIAFEQSCAQTP